MNFDGAYPVTNVNNAKMVYKAPMPRQASYHVRGVVQRCCRISGDNEINQRRAARNISNVRKTGHTHHCEVLPLGHRLTIGSKMHWADSGFSAATIATGTMGDTAKAVARRTRIKTRAFDLNATGLAALR